MDYKETLLMPKTEFQMKGNLPENEEIQRQKWEEMDLYAKIKEKNKGKKPFVLHDGPPYANGDIHIGHAMNKILKDFVNRYYMMSGRDITYIPGWDTHGLPIEQAVTNSGVDRKRMSKAEFRNICEEYAKKQIARQMEGFKKLNVIADWDNYYATFQHELEARQIEVFAEMAKKGLIFKGMKPVYWSPSSESALAEAEIEYKDRKDASIFVAFEVVEGTKDVNPGDCLIIWTTTPWTLPGNTAIAVGPEIEYVKVEVEDKNYVIASCFLEELKSEFKWENVKEICTFKGDTLSNVKYKHVFNDKIFPVVCGDNVTLDAGTGLVHTAPSYGEDDFNLGKLYNLEMVFGINDDGKLNKESGEFEGLYFEDANKAVITKLTEINRLMAVKTITHSYPHDWRTKKPVVFRATAQWFCSIEAIKKDIINEIENNIKWYPEWGKVRLRNMIEGRGDWCISRQRVWGVPLPIFYNEDESPILDYDVMMHVASLFREHGSNYWFEHDAKDLLPEGYTNPASPNGKFTKETDIMDVWFDSGSTHTGVLVERGLDYPADMYLEGSDQYRGWFNSSLICGVAVHGKSPYKECLSHGFTLDAKGNKMSKSLGNGVDPVTEVNKRGADVLRLWVASSDYTEDVRIGDEILKQVTESYRKIRNTYKFLLGNLNDFDPDKNMVEFKDMLPYDKYMMNEFNKYTKEVLESYSKYEFQSVYKATNYFLAFTLSNFYLDLIKDILYIEKEDSKVRRSVQSVLYTIINVLTVLLAPILPYTSEEAYKLIPGNKKESVHLCDMPELKEYEFDEKLWELFFDIKNDTNKALENARNEKLIGSSLEANVYLHLSDKYNVVKEKLGDYIHQLLIVSKVVFTDEELDKGDNIEVKVEKSTGYKCNRCWNYVDKLEGDICDRCHEVLK